MRKVLPIAVFVVFSAGMAYASELDSAREHFAKGTRAYDLGLYDEAIAEYMAAYKIKDDPALLFNIGQAHRLAGHAAEALRFYKTYLSKVPAAQNRSEVEAKMAELNKQLEQQKQKPVEAAPNPPAPSPMPAAVPAEPGPDSQANPAIAPVADPAPVTKADVSEHGPFMHE